MAEWMVALKVVRMVASMAVMRVEKMVERMVDCWVVMMVALMDCYKVASMAV